MAIFTNNVHLTIRENKEIKRLTGEASAVADIITSKLFTADAVTRNYVTSELNKLKADCKALIDNRVDSNDNHQELIDAVSKIRRIAHPMAMYK